MIARWAGAAVVAAVTTTVARRVLDDRPPWGAERWTRQNHRDEAVSMLEGPALTLGLVAGASVAGLGPARCAATVIATGAAGAFGILDDLTEDVSTRTKGLRGHLAAAARGHLTTGAVKVVGIGAAGMLAALVGSDPTATRGRRAADVLVDGALIAASANLVNLLDLRPGRALKAGVASAAGLVLVAPGGAATAAVLGAAAAAAPGDLAERDMLGDGGANALGALLGSQLAFGASRAVRASVLAGVVALTVASERISFSRVIADTPWLHRVDMWGRRPPARSNAE